MTENEIVPISVVVPEVTPIPRASKKAMEQKRCREDLKYLCVEYLGYSDWDVCHDDLEAWVKDSVGSRYRLLLIPRGHLKSSILTVGYTIQRILREPNIRILIANAIWDNARGFLSEIAKHLGPDSKLEALFGVFKAKRWTRDGLVIKQRTRALAAPTVATTGIERTQASQHYDMIILDDVVSRENTSTREQREKVKKFYKDCLSLLEPTGDISIVGTTWNEDDLYNDLRRNPKYKVFIRTALQPANFKTGKPIFPKKFNLETLKGLRDELGMFEFGAQYFLNPYPDEDMEFRMEWIQWYSEIPKVLMYVSMILDPSLGRDNSDFCGLTTTGVTSEGKIYVLDARHFRSKAELIGFEVVRALEDLKRKGVTINRFGLEAIAFQQVLQPMIEAEFKKAGIKIMIDLITIRTQVETKGMRIKGLIPYFSQKKVYLRRDMTDLVAELSKWRFENKGKTDDIIDSLAYQVRYWGNRPADIPQEVAGEGSLIWWMRKMRQDAKTDLFSEYRMKN
jgi:hypothetical protein